MIFQGTCLGPPLWNVYFSDVDATATSTGGRATKYADDLTTHKTYERSTTTDEILNDTATLQTRLHDWGTTRRITFDATKETTVIFHHTETYGDTFRLLATMIDPKLTMTDAIDTLLSKIKSIM